MKGNGAVTEREFELLTLTDVATWLKVSTKTVRKEVHLGLLRATRVGREFRFKRAWVHDYVDRRDR